MSPGVTASDALLGGATAILGPGMPLVLAAILVGATVAGSRTPPVRGRLVTAAVFAVAVAIVWVRADLVPPARFNHWLALLPLLGLIEIRRMKLEWEDWMAPAIGLCTAGLVLFWRVDRFGPTLAALRGDWQQPLTLSPRWIYHLSTGICLGLLLYLFSTIVPRLPGRLRLFLAWCGLAAALILVALDLVAPIQRWLLLHGWPLRVG